MTVAVEQHARAQIVMGAAEERCAVPVDLRYDPEAVLSVCIHFVEPPGPTPDDWEFSRDVLEKGLSAPARSGDIRVWPCGRVQAIVELHSAQGVALVQFDAKALVRFLRRTYAAAAPVAH